MAKWFEMEPPEVYLESACFDMVFHPTEHVVACGLVSNNIQLYQLTEDDSTLMTNIAEHTDAVRSLIFNENGYLMSGSSDFSILFHDLASQTTVQKMHYAHSASVNVLALGSGCFASGDDDGGVKVWDPRDLTKCAMEYSDATQQISSLEFYGSNLYSSDINGHMLKYDVRSKAAITEWELDEEINDLVILDNMVISCGSSKGLTAMNLNLDQLESASAPSAINSFARTPVPGCLAAGSDDGYVRLVSISPLQVNQMLNEEEQMDYVGDQTSPIDKIAASGDGFLLASVSQENIVKFWDIADLQIQFEHGVSGAFFNDI